MRRRCSLVTPVVITAGWMVLDGVHACVVGDNVTPSSGQCAGELGS